MAGVVIRLVITGCGGGLPFDFAQGRSLALSIANGLSQKGRASVLASRFFPDNPCIIHYDVCSKALDT